MEARGTGQQQDDDSLQRPLLDAAQDRLAESRPRNLITSRAVSCQLPTIKEDAPAAPGHRPTQSIDLGSTQLHISWSPSRSQKTEFSYGSKCERNRIGKVLLAIQISALLLLVPAAFLAGYTIASTNAGFGRAPQAVLQRRMTSESGTRRQLPLDSEVRPASLQGSGTTIPAMGPGARMPAMPETQILFVTWIAFGEHGDGGFHTHNFHKVDMRWAEVARMSHPGCKIGLILDQDTLLTEPQNVDFLHRLTIDKKVFGRNEYNDYYHWTGRYSFLEKLMAEGEDKYNIVFLDPDVFVMGDVQEVFDHSGFDYTTTISENIFQPINGAMHFVRAHRYGAAVDVLKGVLSQFQLRPEMGFTAGQQAYADFFELTENKELVKQMQWDAVEKGLGCHTVQGGDFRICYVICTRFNFWEDCSDHPDMEVRSDKAEDYARVGVKVFHFVAYRKLGMQKVYDGFIAGGLAGAQKAWADLPHDEDGFDNDPSFAREA